MFDSPTLLGLLDASHLTVNQLRKDMLVADKVTNAVALAVLDAASALDYSENRLRNAAKAVQNKMEETVRTLDRAGTVNSLGELQSRAGDVDRECALFESYAERLKSALLAYTTVTTARAGA